jgi:hypothetical protein
VQGHVANGAGALPADDAQKHVTVVRSFLRDHPQAMVPLAAHFQARQVVFDSAIRGSSMWPAIPAGARLRVQLLDGDACSSGDIIYFARDDGYMAHRVVYHGWLGATGGYLLTRGDSCIVPDPPVVSSRVLGTVVAVEIDGGWRPGRPGLYLRRRTGGSNRKPCHRNCAPLGEPVCRRGGGDGVPTNGSGVARRTPTTPVGSLTTRGRLIES